MNPEAPSCPVSLIRLYFYPSHFSGAIFLQNLSHIIILRVKLFLEDIPGYQRVYYRGLLFVYKLFSTENVHFRGEKALKHLNSEKQWSFVIQGFGFLGDFMGRNPGK